MNTTWITSDLHFGHANILKYNAGTRPWGSIQEMEEGLINEWNQKVKEDDVIIHLGDFAFAKSQRIAEIIQRLNGQILFVRGNHDKPLDNALTMVKLKYPPTIRNYLEMKFDDNFIVMCHYPMLVWNKSHYNSFMLHGHCHGSLNHLNAGTRRMDVGYDSLGQIMKLSDVLKMMENNVNPVVDHHKGD